MLQAKGAGQPPAYSTATFPSIATGTGTILRADGTNWVATTATYPSTTTANQILYSSATNTIGQITTANSGVLTTNSSGVPSIDTTNFAVLSTGVQMKGNNTNTAAPSGFIGEYITAATNALSTNNTNVKDVATITLTPGIWNISIICTGSCTTQNISVCQAGISTTSATFQGNKGDQYGLNQGGTSLVIDSTVSVPNFRALVSTNTNYILVGRIDFSGGAGTLSGRISATRVG